MAVRRELEAIREQNVAAVEAEQPVDESNALQLRTLVPFLGFADERFRSIIGGDPYYRLIATPVPLNEHDYRNQWRDVLRVLEHPPELRAHGFDVTPTSSFQRIDLGLACTQTTYHHLRFLWNGHLEFWSKMTDLSHLFEYWGEHNAQYRVLCGIGFIERAENFVRLLRTLFDVLQYTGALRIEMAFYNVRGVYLMPHDSNHWDYMEACEAMGQPHGPRPLAGDVLRVLSVEAQVAELPGDVGWRLVRQVYYRFNYADEHIPYYDADHHTDLDERRPRPAGGTA